MTQRSLPCHVSVSQALFLLLLVPSCVSAPAGCGNDNSESCIGQKGFSIPMIAGIFIALFFFFVGLWFTAMIVHHARRRRAVRDPLRPLHLYSPALGHAPRRPDQAYVLTGPRILRSQPYDGRSPAPVATDEENPPKMFGNTHEGWPIWR